MTFREEQIIFNRIEELEKKQKEQDEIIKKIEEKIRFASMGFPTNLF